jgi:hypothetical protein
MIPTITVATDASYVKFHKQNIAAWACYIRTATQTIKTGGLLKDGANGSTWAERFALANALFIAEKVCTLEDYRLIIYSDAVANLNKPSKVRTPASKYYAKNKEAHDWYDQNIGPILAKAKSYELRYVKAHAKEEDWDRISKRNYLNFWCDQEAKKIMREERRRILEAINNGGSK